MRDALIQDLMDRVEKRLAAMIDGPDYRTVLTSWIVEAAIGLDAETATVNASERERPLIDAAMLDQARQAVLSKTGKHVTLTLSDAPPLKGQGVVLTSRDGRMAFNNQVRTRMLRKQRQMRRLIYDGLFASPREE